MTAGYAANSDARKRNAEAAQTAPDAATVAAVLAEHRDDFESGDYGEILWSGCSCGHEHPFAEHDLHIAKALLAAPPIAQALAAVEAVARVEALAAEWEVLADYVDDPASTADQRARSRAGVIAAQQLRAALNPRADQ